MSEPFETYQPEQSMDAIQDTMETFIETGHVNRAYGDPVEHGEKLIIPTAEVVVAMGFGAGYGSGSSASEEENRNDQGKGGGGGGGGKTFSRPVAVIIATPESVRVEPVVDVTKVALAALTAGGFMIATLFRMLNPKKALKEIQPN